MLRRRALGSCSCCRWVVTGVGPTQVVTGWSHRAGRSHHTGHRLLWRRTGRSVGGPHLVITPEATDGNERFTGATLSRPPETVRIKAAMQKRRWPPRRRRGRRLVSYKSCWPLVSPAPGSTTQWCSSSRRLCSAAPSLGLATAIGGYFVNLSGVVVAFCVVHPVHRQRVHRCAILRRRSLVGVLGVAGSIGLDWHGPRLRARTVCAVSSS
jgi:hypothetical protein